MTSLCCACPEKYFAPYDNTQEHVGCCSYSPEFSLFEIGKMVKAGQTDYFMNEIYRNSSQTTKDYSIIIHAYINGAYEALKKGVHFSEMEESDLVLKFSVCQFFVSGKGCGLNPYFKNTTCRSFICSAVEEQLDQAGKEMLQESVRLIREEADAFNAYHQNKLKKEGWNLRGHIDQILEYLDDL